MAGRRKADANSVHERVKRYIGVTAWPSAKENGLTSTGTIGQLLEYLG